MRKNKGLFKKGMIPWNKGKYGYMGANKTSFKSNDINAIGLDSVGVPREGHGNLVCLTNERKEVTLKNGKKYMIRKRMSYCRWLLQQQGIDVAPDEVIYHKDGNMWNNEIGNLEIIKRSELIKRNRGLK